MAPRRFTETDTDDLLAATEPSQAMYFGPGTKILTALGPQPIECLTTGDRVWTRDSGLQPIRWIDMHTQPGYGDHAPVVIGPGALHNNVELTVSQEQRILLCGPIPNLLLGEGDLLVAAKRLCGLPDVSVRPIASATYYQFSFDQDQVVYANGMLSECRFQPSQDVNASQDLLGDDLPALFPSLADALKSLGATVALSLKAHDASALRAKLAKRLH